MAMTDTWVVPGAPLAQGRGWRVWYSRPGTDDFEPGKPTVFLRTTKQEIECDCDLFDATRGVDRRMAVQTIRLKHPQPGAAYTVQVPERPAPFTWRSMPESCREGVSFLMSSCFWRNDDKEGHYGAGVADLTKKFSPAFQLLVGDQLYQDWPIRLAIGKDPYEIFGDRYIEYWSDDVYRQLLGCTPNFFACDDHEFWNNYPEPQPQVFWTIGENRRARAQQAARELLHRFQHGANPGGRSYYSFAIGEVAFFVADPRSERTRFGADPHGFFSREQWMELVRWVSDLKGPGVLVLPQPLFQRAGGPTDYSLANFAGDYSRLCGVFESALDGETMDGRPHDILILTGDIHTGRHAVGTPKRPVSGDVHEFAASPASLVGPFQPLQKASMAPGKLFPRGRASWSVWETSEAGSPTIDNNVAHIRISTGLNARIRFELELWRVRPHDNRRYWQRALRRPKPKGPLVRLFRKEIELR